MSAILPNSPALEIEFINTFILGDDFATRGTNSVPASLDVKYYDGTAFVPATAPQDGTSKEGATFGQNGRISWGVLADWTSTSVNGTSAYWIQLTPSNAIDPITISDIKVIAEKSTYDDLTDIMALAPSPWVLAGYASTVIGVDRQWTNQTVLEALVEAMREAGERFRIEVDPANLATPKVVRFLRTDVAASGCQLVAGNNNAQGNSETGYIVSINKHTDTHVAPTRMYVTGGGSGEAELTLASSTNSVPAGYSVNRDESYIALSPEPTPRVDGKVKFPAIVGDAYAPLDRLFANKLLSAAFAGVGDSKGWLNHL